MTAHDRRHLVAVHRGCVAAGLSAEVATAGLLHDVGKASLSGRTVTLSDRALRVVLGRAAPSLLDRLAHEPAPPPLLGLRLARHHAEIGADRLAALGWSPPVVDAVRRHEAPGLEGQVAVLRRIDEATV